jgi:ribosomal-protein-alanine N-acetyltransferase
MSVMATGAIVIRPAERRDLPALVAIENASFSDPWTEESFASALALDRMRVLVAEELGEEGRGGGPIVVGYVLALLLGEEAEIADLAIAPEARRRGIARALLDRIEAESRTRGAMILYLEVRESNAAARALYESRGFSAVGRRSEYYRHPPEDALILRREMDQT